MPARVRELPEPIDGFGNRGERADPGLLREVMQRMIGGDHWRRAADAHAVVADPAEAVVDDDSLVPAARPPEVPVDHELPGRVHAEVGVHVRDGRCGSDACKAMPSDVAH